jgi:hypothetical protein
MPDSRHPIARRHAAVRRRPAPRPAALPALVIAIAVLAGCGGTPSTDQQRYVGAENPYSGMLQNPFKRPTEAGFLSLVRHHCAGLGIGGSSVGALLASDASFKTLTSKLYRGDISNDEYINQVLAMHPADDANVPATGCIIDQLQDCLAGRCEVTASAGPATPRDPAQLEPTIDQTPVPAAEREQVDAMIEEADRERAATPTPLP